MARDTQPQISNLSILRYGVCTLSEGSEGVYGFAEVNNVGSGMANRKNSMLVCV